MLLNVKSLDYKVLNETLRRNATDITLEECCGQRFIAAGMSDKNITINGVPGNALGAYLNGATITVNANAQDAVGDTMNEGKSSCYGDRRNSGQLSRRISSRRCYRCSRS